MMRRRLSLLCSLICLAITGCNDPLYISDGCLAGSLRCADDTVYVCVGVSDPEKQFVDKDFKPAFPPSVWEPHLKCATSCDATGVCRCPDECPGNCNVDGSCICPSICINGCTSAGTCICFEAYCQNGCEANGTCRCPEHCANGCNPDGSCVCPICASGATCDVSSGTCNCPECVTGGACNHQRGTCECSDKCQNRCNTDGSCMCPNCVDGSACDPSTGTCKCPQTCSSGCAPDGSCKDLCINVNCPAEEYCVSGECKSIDSNRNHLHDQYETAFNKDKACKVHSDCDSSPGKGDGFCDSFIGYKCSTKCTSDKQCVDDGQYHYLCRTDGRCSPDSFITVWSIPNDSKSLTIPLDGADKCNFTVNWGDNDNWEPYNTCPSEISHIYAQQGNYTVTIKGTLNGFGRSYAGSLQSDQTIDHSASKLVEVKAFGPVGIGTGAFAFCSNLKKLSEVDIPSADKFIFSNYNFIFFGATSFNQPIEHWDVSQMTNMDSMFSGAKAFNQPLGKWDTSHVKSMDSMFNGAKAFNQPLDAWDTSNVAIMSFMFSETDVFDQPIGSWNTSNVTTMWFMFSEALAFNQFIGNWNTSKVANMGAMFLGTQAFNQPIGAWNTAKVTNMEAMFMDAPKFNQAIMDWNVSSVESLESMFSNAKAFAQDLSAWKVNPNANTSVMFDSCGLSQALYCKITCAWGMGQADLGMGKCTCP